MLLLLQSIGSDMSGTRLYLTLGHGVTYPHYHPQARSIDLDTQLKPFIPDYIPSVGSIDEFIKVPRPDAKPDYLGLKVRPTTWDSR